MSVSCGASKRDRSGCVLAQDDRSVNLLGVCVAGRGRGECSEKSSCRLPAGRAGRGRKLGRRLASGPALQKQKPRSSQSRDDRGKMRCWRLMPKIPAGRSSREGRYRLVAGRSSGFRVVGRLTRSLVLASAAVPSAAPSHSEHASEKWHHPAAVAAGCFRDGRHRLQRRVRARFTRASLLAPSCEETCDD
jgi:hypothetical protein